jgi:DNA-binding transcriptional ArsR family regulator
MTRTSVLLGLALMIAVAAASPATVWWPAGSRDVGALAGEAAPQLAASGIFCYNCSDLPVAPADVSISSAQPTSQSLPGNLPFMVAIAWGQDEQEEAADAWVWRGKMRSRWENVGFDSGTFELFMTMKGAGTRLSLLDALSIPKDRMQLAQELGLDWKAVDYQMIRLNRCGLVQEDRAFGKVKLYRLTTLGGILLKLLRESKSGAPVNDLTGPGLDAVVESRVREAPNHPS